MTPKHVKFYISLLCSLLYICIGALADGVYVDVVYGPPVIRPAPDGCAKVELDLCATAARPGAPLLPVQTLFYALPPDTDISSIVLKTEQISFDTISLSTSVCPGSPMGANNTVSYGDVVNLVNGRDMDIYGVDCFYPASSVRIESVGHMRKWVIVRLEVYPVQYNPILQTLRTIQSARFVLFYAQTNQRDLSAALADDMMDQKALNLIANPEKAQAWYGTGRSFEAVSASNVYTIITSDTIYNQSSNLYGFVDHKESIGFNVQVVTETKVDGDAGATGWNEVTGQAPDEKADRIRKWLQDNYLSNHIRYVLLVGDPRTGTGDVPMKMCYPRYGEISNPQYTNSPTDYYYADLTGDWDKDGDLNFGVYGTSNDGGVGGVDFMPEVYVGRFPVYGTDYASLSNIVVKSIRYEMSVATNWRKSAILPESFSDTDGTDGAFLGECMRTNYIEGAGYETYTMYQQGSISASYDSDFESDEELLNYAVPNRWRANSYGLICWWAHGWSQGAAINGGGTLMSSAKCSELDDRKPALAYMASCTCSDPDDSNNLGFALLKKGAIASVSATRVSWYRVGEWYPNTLYADNAQIGYSFMQQVVTNQSSFGQALYDAKSIMGTLWQGASWMNQFDFNLYGDPGIQLLETYGVDADQDRIPDYWEVLHGLSTNDPSNAASDSDSDGFCTYQEYWNNTSPTNADTMLTSYSSMSAAGNFQGWAPASNNMSLIDNYTWACEQVFEAVTNLEFKFAANGNWTANWGDSDQSEDGVPLWAMTDSSGSNIVVTNNLDGQYRFTFNERTLWYALDASVSNDFDRDGMPLEWEQLSGLNPYNPEDALSDYDADTVDALTEYQWGTHPRRDDSDFDTWSDGVDPSPTQCAYTYTTFTASCVGYVSMDNGTVVYDESSCQWGVLPGKTNTGFLKFDVSSLPDTARIRVAALLYNAQCTQTTESVPETELVALQAVDPSLVYAATDTYQRIFTGDDFQTRVMPEVENIEEALYINGTGRRDVECRLGAGTWAVGFMETNGWNQKVVLSNVILVLSYEDDGTYQSDYDEMSVAGTFNGWLETASNMSLVGHGLWAMVTNLNEASGFGFKLAAGNWDTNWGDNGQTDFSAPMTGTADAWGANITNQDAAIGDYVFTFDEYNLMYAVSPLNQSDGDHDGMADDWEIAQGYDPFNSADAMADTDNDGLLNCYEFENDGDPDNPDCDADGFNDFAEVIAGTALSNAQSYFSSTVSNPNPSNHCATISWEAVANRVYDVMYCSELGGDNWAGVPDRTNLTGLAGTQQFVVTNVNSSATREYYRVRVSRP